MPDLPVEMSDRELLLVVYDRVERIDETVNGNGQPGLAERVTRVEERVEDVEGQTTTKREKAGVAASILAVVAAVAAQAFGLRVPM